MEEHCQAYFAWKKLGWRDQWCWHVDAHLDIGKTDLGASRLEQLRGCASSVEAKEAGLMGNSYLPWGGLHCGNYLLPAIMEGIVSKLTWVIPPDLPEGALLTWARRHLNNWFELDLQEYASLAFENERVVGTLLGIPVEIGTLEHLTLPDEPVLMDIDIDYFLTEQGEPWQDSDVFAEQIQSVPVAFQTVAYSVIGGFTPDQQRRLAAPFVRESTEGYQATQLDRLAGLVRCHQYDEVLAAQWDLGEQAEVEAGFLIGTSFQAKERYQEALQYWHKLLGHAQVGAGGRAYLHGLCAEIYNHLGEARKALGHALEAQELEPENHLHFWNEAVAREKLGDLRRTQKVLRKTIKLSEHLLFGLQARYALSKVYSQQGKDGLANIELKKLGQLDVTGRFRPATMLAT